MDLTIIAPGSRGDVQPYVALAKGFQRAGHTVRLVTTRDHASLATAHGLEAWVADIDVEAELRRPDTRSAIEGGGLVRSFRRLSEIAARTADLLAERALSASSGTDAILSGFGGLFLALAIAEKVQLPLIQAYNVPITPTAAFPGVLTPWLSFPPRSVTHRLGHRITRQAIWLAARASSNGARRRKLGLSSAPWIGRFGSGAPGASPVFYGLSPSVVSRPPDWGEGIHMAGFWFLDEDPGWRPSAELERFLRGGPAPVYIGFGSMASRDPRGTAELVLDAVARSGRRAVIDAGWGGLAPGDLPETVVAVDSVPHAWLFPRMAAVVHHGGAGTTAAGIRAGVPTVVVPFHGDQPFWGHVVRELGVGPAPVARRRLTAAALADAIATAVSDPVIADRASALGTKVRAEDGVGATVSAIEGWLG